MTVQDFIAVLPSLPDDAQVTISVRKGDLVHALQERAGGPEVLTTAEASARCGYPADRWRRWAERGRIAGAWQDAEGGHWRLPRASCEAHVRQLQQRGRAEHDAPASPESRSAPHGSAGSRTRGPRKRAALQREQRQHQQQAAPAPHDDESHDEPRDRQPDGAVVPIARARGGRAAGGRA